MKFGSSAPMKKVSKSRWKNNKKWLKFIEKKFLKIFYRFDIKMNTFPYILYIIPYTMWSFVMLHQWERLQKYPGRKILASSLVEHNSTSFARTIIIITRVLGFLRNLEVSNETSHRNSPSEIESLGIYWQKFDYALWY